MKLFTAILLGALIALSFGTEVVHTPDTTYIGNTVKVELQVPQGQKVEIAQKSETQDLIEATRFTSDSVQTEKMIDAAKDTALWTFLAVIFSAIAVVISLLVWYGSSIASIGITDHHWIAQSIDGFWIHIGLKNHGHSNTKRMMFRYNFKKVGRNNFKAIAHDLPFEDYLPECAPGETVVLKAGVRIPEEDIRNKREGVELRDLVFWGIIHYWDIFGIRHQKPFRFYVTWPDEKDRKLTLNRWHTDYYNEKENEFFRGLD